MEESGTSPVRSTAQRLVDIGRHGDTMDTRVVRGSVLALSTRLLIKAVQFSRTIVIARLLFPNDVGLFAVAAASLGLAEMLIQPGLSSAVIRKEEITDKHLNTAWTAILIRSIFIGAIAFLLAPLGATFIGTEAIVPIIQVLAIAVAFNGLENIGAVLLVRDMRFNRKMLYDVSLVVMETIAIIVAAFVLQNAWALVVGVLVNKLTAVSMSYVIHPYRPKLSFDMEAFEELFSFGKWVGVTSVASYVISQGDTLATGRLLGTEAAGFYALAFGLALLPAVEIARTLGSVMFPHLSRLPQEERGSAFLKTVRSVLLISVPATIGLALIVEPLVSIVYGERWLPMLVPFYVLIAYAGVRTCSYLIEPLYLSMGRPRFITTATFLHLGGMVLTIVPLGKTYGLAGIAGAVLFGSLLSLFYLLWGIRKDTVVRLRSLARSAGLPCVAAGVMAVFLVGFEYVIPIQNAIILVSAIGIGVVTYSIALFSIDALRGGSVRRSLIWFKENL